MLPTSGPKTIGSFDNSFVEFCEDSFYVVSLDPASTELLLPYNRITRYLLREKAWTYESETSATRLKSKLWRTRNDRLSKQLQGTSSTALVIAFGGETSNIRHRLLPPSLSLGVGLLPFLATEVHIYVVLGPADRQHPRLVDFSRRSGDIELLDCMGMRFPRTHVGNPPLRE